MGLPWEREAHEGGAPDRLTKLADEILVRCRGDGPVNCVARCPLHVDARGYVQLTRQGRYREALQLVREKLPFPGVLGYICSHPCELHCKRIDRDSAIRIRDIKRFLAEWEPGEPQHLLDCEPRRQQKIAVVGSGPSGLIAAHDLARGGYAVTLFEREAEIGGCLTHKLPPWRLPRHVVRRDLSIIEALPIDVRTEVCFGRDISLEALRQQYQAVLLLCGYEGGLGVLRNGHGLRRTIRGTVRADPLTCETGVPGVYAGGEAVSGPGSVIDALALGRRCAESARRGLEGGRPGNDRRRPRPARLLWTLEIDETERRRRERTPVTLRPYNEPLGEARAREEAERCLACECRLCVKDCEFLARHCRSPKDLARRVRNGLGNPDTLKMVYSCNLCSLCATVCPEHLDTGALLIEARREAVSRGHGPLPEHEPVVSHFKAGTSRRLSLLMSEPGRGRSKRLFFPGCALPEAAPDHALEIYDVLRRSYRSTGVLMYCCGAPVDSIGLESEPRRAREAMLRMVESVGAEELITVCPDCTYTLKAAVPELRITSAWELLAETWQPSRRRDGVVVSVHDSCRTRGEPGLQAAVRRLVERGGGTVAEVEYSGKKARCCGFGGRIRTVDPELAAGVSRRAGASSLPLVTYCTDCRTALADGGNQAVHILDFLLSPDWHRALRAKRPHRWRRYANRLRTKASFHRLRPLGAG